MTLRTNNQDGDRRMKLEIQKASTYILHIALIICTILIGGSNWYCCIIPILLFLIYVMIYRKEILTAQYTVIMILIITGSIAVAFTVGDKQNAMYEYEKIFFAGKCIKNKDTVLRSILICSLMAAGAGLLAYCNLIQIEEFTFNDRYIIRLQSFLKYANTTALLLGCGYFSAMKLLNTSSKKPIAYISAVVLIALYLTVSKAAIPLFLLLESILFLVERKYVHQFIMQNLICMFFAVLIILAGYWKFRTIQFLLIIMCVCIGGYAGSSDKNVQFNKYLLWIWCGGFVCFFTAICALFLVNHINIFETLIRRFDYMKDALTLLKRHWLFGIGPGAWKYYQNLVQTTQYSVTYVHNAWLQMWLDYGIIFFVAMLIVLAKTLWRFATTRQYLLLTITVFIIAHSFVDINLSFGLILILLGLLAGIALREEKQIKLGKPVFYAIIVCSCLMLGYMTIEYTVRNMFEQAYTKNNSKKAAQYALVLEKICPYDSNLQISLAALGQGDVSARIEKAIELSPMDISLRETKIEYAIGHGETSVIDQCRQYVKMAKHQERVYIKAEQYAGRALNAGLCMQDEYEAFMDELEVMRKEFNVVNRNKLLDEIVNKK